MEFAEATDALTACVGHAAIAAELGVSLQTIRQARLDPANRNHRSPPVAWRKALARIARHRAAALENLAAQLEAEDEPLTPPSRPAG